ncbi:VOC family protein [Ancylobacter terrae]|uniref:VOC family protein n=1 Tax=Ancylobacter sp. sgz301288 TaxID=3342077 RepID=UPI00385E6B8A
MQLLVNIDVPDLGAAEAFYAAAFGLVAARRFGAGGVEMVGATAPIYLLAHPPGSTAVRGTALARDYARHWTPVHLDVVVADLDQALDRALSAGAILESPRRDEAWGSIAVCADPFGHGFCLIEFTARGYDAVASAAPASS